MEKALISNSSEKSQLKDLIEANNERIKQLESQNSQLKGTVAQTEEQKSEASQTIKQLKVQLQYVLY